MAAAPPHHPRLKVVNGGRPGKPETAASSRLTTLSLLAAGAAPGRQSRRALPLPPPTQCWQLRQLSAGERGHRPPISTHSMRTVAAAPGRQAGPPLPATSTTQCWPRLPSSGAKFWCVPHQQHPLNDSSGGRRPPPYLAASYPRTPHSLLTAPATVRRNTWLPRPPYIPHAMLIVAATPVRHVRRYPPQKPPTHCSQRRPPPAAILVHHPPVIQQSKLAAAAPTGRHTWPTPPPVSPSQCW